MPAGLENDKAALSPLTGSRLVGVATFVVLLRYVSKVAMVNGATTSMGARVKYMNKKGTRTLKPSSSWFEPAYSSRFDAHSLIFKKCRETLM
jgi:hypothetical protein